MAGDGPHAGRRRPSHLPLRPGHALANQPVRRDERVAGRDRVVGRGRGPGPQYGRDRASPWLPTTSGSPVKVSSPTAAYVASMPARSVRWMPRDCDTARMNIPEKQSAWVSSRRMYSRSVALLAGCWAERVGGIKIAGPALQRVAELVGHHHVGGPLVLLGDRGHRRGSRLLK